MTSLPTTMVDTGFVEPTLTVPEDVQGLLDVNGKCTANETSLLWQHSLDIDWDNIFHREEKPSKVETEDLLWGSSTDSTPVFESLSPESLLKDDPAPFKRSTNVDTPLTSYWGSPIAADANLFKTSPWLKSAMYALNLAPVKPPCRGVDPALISPPHHPLVVEDGDESSDLEDSNDEADAKVSQSESDFEQEDINSEDTIDSSLVNVATNSIPTLIPTKASSSLSSVSTISDTSFDRIPSEELCVVAARSTTQTDESASWLSQGSFSLRNAVSSHHAPAASASNVKAKPLLPSDSSRQSSWKRPLEYDDDDDNDADDDVDYKDETDEDSEDGDYRDSGARHIATRPRTNKRFKSTHSDATSESSLSTPEPQPRRHVVRASRGRTQSRPNNGGSVTCEYAAYGCRETFSRPHDIRRHLSSGSCHGIANAEEAGVDIKVKKGHFPCLCGKSTFSREDALKRHVRNSRQKNRNSPCGIPANIEK